MVQPLPKMQSNPLAAIQAFTQPRRNQLAGLASGLLSSPNFGQGLSAGFAQAAQGRQIDDAYAVSQKEAAQRQEQLAKTISYLRTQPGGSTWADAVENQLVDPQEAFKSWYEESKGTAAPKPIEINGQLVDIATGKVLGDYRDKPADKQPDAPSGYQWDPAKPGALMPIPNGPQDPVVKEASKPPTESQQRAASLVHVVTPELDVIEKNWDQLDNWENQVMGGKLPFTDWAPAQGFTSAGNQQAQNSLKTIISSYLYAISGATANPGEVQNNIDILTPKMGESQDSVKAKKDRVRRMVEAIQIQAKGGMPKPVDGIVGGGSTEPSSGVLVYNPVTGELE